MVTKHKILTFLKAHKDELFTDYNLTKIGLFGSFAKNESSKESDIDLMIEFQPNTPNLYEKKSAIKNRIKKEFGRKVDLCREKYIKPYFKTHILQSAIYV